jgi:O-antigen ligase
LVAGVVAAIGVTFSPAVTLSGLAVIAAAAALLRRPHWAIYLVVLLGLTALPAVVPTSIPGLAGIQVYVYEPVLAVAAVWAVAQSLPRYVWRRAGVIALVFVAATLLGVVGGTPLQQVLVDPRGLLDMQLAYIVAAAVMARPDLTAKVLRLLRWSLSWSAALTLIASATGLELGGLTEDASLFLNGTAEASGALRIVTSATHLSLGVLCACVGLLVSRRAKFSHVLPYVSPATLIVFLSYSRNSLLALAAALLVALLLYAGSWWGAAVTLARVAAFTALGGFLLYAGYVILQIPIWTFLEHQATAYGSRVVEGLSSTAISSDASVQYRVLENLYLWQAIDTSPLLGHGFGYAYKPAYGQAGSFTATSGQWYAHNFYLWLIVKGGIVGLLAFLYWAMTPLAALARGSTAAIALGLGGVGLIAVSFVAPIPLSANGCLALGGALGALALVRSQELAQRREMPVPQTG